MSDEGNGEPFMKIKRRALGLALVLNGSAGCSKPLSPEAYSVSVMALTDDALFVQFHDASPSPAWSHDRANVSRHDGHVDITFLATSVYLPSNADFVGVPLNLRPDDNEIRITDGKSCKVIWTRAGKDRSPSPQVSADR